MLTGEGVYQQQQASAEAAYQAAVNSLEQKKNTIYQQYGFDPKSGNVDPYNHTGMYQSMRHDQGVELDNAQESALDRGLGSKGLGAQVAEAPRFGQEIQSANLMRDYLGGLHDVQLGELDALRQKNDTLLSARQQQIADAMQAGAWDGGGGMGGGGVGSSADWLYGSSLPSGVSGESVYNTALQYAPSYNGVQFVPGHIMNQGQIVNGKIAVKFQDPTGQSNSDTIWIPVPQADYGDSGGGSAPPAATARQQAPGKVSPIVKKPLPTPAPKKPAPKPKPPAKGRR